MKKVKMSRELAEKVLATVDAGLTSGKGHPKPGYMCVEAAVCYAMGLPHSDNPPCVGNAVRSFKIALNDAKWPSDTERAHGMRKLAIAQLGSENIDQRAFAEYVAVEVTKRVVPLLLRNAARLNPDHAEALEKAAVDCEDVVDIGTCKTASANAANAANASAATTASAAAANAAAAYAAYAIPKELVLQILNLTAEIGLEALIKCKSKGCEWLDLCN